MATPGRFSLVHHRGPGSPRPRRRLAAQPGRREPAGSASQDVGGWGTRGLSRRFGLLAPWHRGSGFGLVAGGPEALLRTLLGKPVACADLNPRGSGLAGSLNLGGLQFLCRFSQVPGGFESAHRPVGDVESAERSGDPLNRTLGGHQVSVVDNRSRSMIR